jgi:hypothetical protein
MKLLAAISHHGLGHLAQAAPVLNALHVLQPDLELTVWSGLSRAALQARLRIPFVHRAEAADVGLAMTDAMRVNVADSRAAYLAFHENWDARVADEAAWLKARGFDGVFSDVAYLPLAAAALAGIPAVALCSLNWRDIAGAYLAGHPDMAPLLERMRQAYQGARAFLCPTPAMPMAWLDNRAVVPPIMERGVDRRHELAQALEQHRDGRRPTRRVLVGFGGIGYRGMGRLPELPGVTWLAPTTGRKTVRTWSPSARRACPSSICWPPAMPCLPRWAMAASWRRRPTAFPYSMSTGRIGRKPPICATGWNAMGTAGRSGRRNCSIRKSAGAWNNCGPCRPRRRWCRTARNTPPGA